MDSIEGFMGHQSASQANPSIDGDLSELRSRPIGEQRSWSFSGGAMASRPTMPSIGFDDPFDRDPPQLARKRMGPFLNSLVEATVHVDDGLLHDVR